jgi:cytochrome bd-type quinol oxidase subunit 1
VDSSFSRSCSRAAAWAATAAWAAAACTAAAWAATTGWPAKDTGRRPGTVMGMAESSSRQTEEQVVRRDLGESWLYYQQSD